MRLRSYHSHAETPTCVHIRTLWLGIKRYVCVGDGKIEEYQDSYNNYTNGEQNNWGIVWGTVCQSIYVFVSQKVLKMSSCATPRPLLCLLLVRPFIFSSASCPEDINPLIAG